jgi:hypothetical protein
VPVAAGAGGAQRACQLCARPAPLGTAAWLCECGLRGDLPFDHPINAALWERATLVIARGAPASSTGSSSTGQSTGAAAAAADTLQTKLERHFEKELKRTPKQGGAFAGGVAPLSFTHKNALAEVRKAYKASRTEVPSQQLIDLIRAGGLVHVGFGIPRSLAQVRKEEESTGATLTVGATSVPLGSGGAIMPPAVESLQSFCSALFSTILPALADNPRAISTWCTLGRTALEFEREGGCWSAAQTYIDELLHERVVAGEGDYSAVSDSVRISTQAEFSRLLQRAQPMGNAPRQQQAGGGGKLGGSERAVCRAFNKGGCSYDPCKWPHFCWVRSCRGKHSISECNKAKKSDHESLNAPLPPRASDGASVKSAPSVGSKRRREETKGAEQE